MVSSLNGRRLSAGGRGGEIMLGPVRRKFFTSDTEEVEQSENFRTADHMKPFQLGKWKGGGREEGETWRKVEKEGDALRCP